MGRHKEIEIVTTKCIYCKEIVFPEKTNIGDNVYKCPECGCFLELEEEEKIVVFDSELDLDPTIH